MFFLLRLLPRFRGKKFIYKTVSKLFRLKQFHVIKYCGSEILVEPKASYSQLDVFLNSDSFDFSEVSALRKVISKSTTGGVFIDIGAHIGLYCVALNQSLIKANVRVIAVEPNEYLIPQLKFNLLRNLSIPCVCINQALSNVKGTSVLYLNNINSGETSLLERAMSTKVQVPTETLTNILNEHCSDQEPIFIKIDAEGHEHTILEETLLTGKYNIRYILTEITHENTQKASLHNLLINQGFIVEAMIGENTLYQLKVS